MYKLTLRRRLQQLRFAAACEKEAPKGQLFRRKSKGPVGNHRRFRTDEFRPRGRAEGKQKGIGYMEKGANSDRKDVKSPLDRSTLHEEAPGYRDLCWASGYFVMVWPRAPRKMSLPNGVYRVASASNLVQLNVSAERAPMFPLFAGCTASATGASVKGEANGVPLNVLALLPFENAVLPVDKNWGIAATGAVVDLGVAANEAAGVRGHDGEAIRTLGSWSLRSKGVHVKL
ncbi:hypothetical protein B0H14DRAFT_3557771 [Mycena olivaceomarginata]|nr:hypothetical protein B0H14DRAFT_3557771 [Mycena olivaceomarginata]